MAKSKSSRRWLAEHFQDQWVKQAQQSGLRSRSAYIKKLHDIVRRHRACLAWGGTAQLSPADDIMIAVERPL